MSFFNDKLSRQLEWFLAESRNQGRERQAADPTSAAAAQNLSLGHGVELLYGRVVDAVPYTNSYKVFVERGMPVMICDYMSPGPNGAIGAKAVSSIPPGSSVWVIYHRQRNHGTIIGVASYFMTDGALALSDYIYPGGRSGLHRDIAHSLPFTLNTRGVSDWSAGRPFDSTLAGEWGAITETGLRVILDSFMAQIGAGEACGLYAYLWDNLCRVTGLNLQIRSNAFERESLDDESEHYDLEGRCVYPWEVMGLSRHGQQATKTNSAQDTEIDKPWYSAIEPQHDDQAPIHRVRHFGGYLGQGGTRLLTAPIAQSGINRYSQPVQQASLFEEHISLTGGYSLRSASDIIIAKRPLIPVIRTKLRPEATDGDRSENYKASGLLGDGDEHVVKGDIEVQGDVEKPLLRAASVEDIHAYVFNWDNVHPFHYHKQDWELSEEKESPLGSSIPIPSLKDLSQHNKICLDSPPTASINVDHRYNTVEYALSTSYISMLKDGGVVIGDGYGSEIRMTGGNIYLTAPGDIWQQPGRNAVTWAGRDITMRAKNCADLSTTEGDVRIKAERHTWISAGNNESNGALLLESRATSTEYNFDKPDNFAENAQAGGVVIRAKQGNIVNWGQNVYLRTGGGNVNNGSIVLDAGRGSGAIMTNSAGIVNFLSPSASAGVFHAFYDVENDKATVTKLHQLTSSNMFIDGSAQIMGFCAIDGQTLTNDWIFVNNGHIMTTEASNTNGRVLGMEPDVGTGWFEQTRSDLASAVDQLKEYHKTNIHETWYADNKAGNDTVMTNGEFSFRESKAQYNTVSDDDTLQFRLFETRWQQMAAASSAGLPWQERSVKTQDTETMPYPGFDAFNNEESFVKIPHTLFDVDKQIAKDRGEDAELYTEPKFGEPELSALKSGYNVIG